MNEYNEEQEFNGQEFNNEPKERPSSLTILCVLSALNAVYQAIANISVWGMYNKIHEFLDEGSEMYEQMSNIMGDDWEQMAIAYSEMFSVNRGYYLFCCILYIASFVGVMQMWRLNKRGFHVYTIAQILILIVSTIFVYNTLNGSPISDLIITAMFVVLYFMHYRKVMQ